MSSVEKSDTFITENRDSNKEFLLNIFKRDPNACNSRVARSSTHAAVPIRTSGSAMAEGPREKLEFQVYRVALFV